MLIVCFCISTLSREGAEWTSAACGGSHLLCSHTHTHNIYVCNLAILCAKPTYPSTLPSPVRFSEREQRSLSTPAASCLCIYMLVVLSSSCCHIESVFVHACRVACCCCAAVLCPLLPAPMWQRRVGPGSVSRGVAWLSIVHTHANHQTQHLPSS